MGMVMGGNWTYLGDYFVLYPNINYYVVHMKLMLHTNFTSINKSKYYRSGSIYPSWWDAGASFSSQRMTARGAGSTLHSKCPRTLGHEKRASVWHGCMWAEQSLKPKTWLLQTIWLVVSHLHWLAVTKISGCYDTWLCLMIAFCCVHRSHTVRSPFYFLNPTAIFSSYKVEKLVCMHPLESSFCITFWELLTWVSGLCLLAA